ncbi:MAG TPA: PilC/PilY family type IV pilus protein, partial [Steroidobacteraceae bacterium]|nr:PilC/PilY family type IV pilus protein [Steroidobacteraceae bacterium]
LYEAYRYFRGDAVYYGLNSTACSSDMSGTCSGSTVNTPSISAARTGSGNANYLSPITSSCQQNYIVFLTDGLPNNDNNANTLIEGLDTAAGNTCYSGSSTMWQALGYSSVPSITYYDGTTGLCLKEMSRNLKNKDLSTLTGNQNVTTYFIGFGNNVGAGAPQAYLADAANAGGGTAEIAADAAELATAFERTIGAVLDSSSTFTSPSVAVNSFNKTQVLEDLYVSMFEPTQNKHWPGNVKKFKFRDNKIVGRGSTMTSVDTVSAVDPATGFFTRNTKDFWHKIADGGLGNDTTAGGATNSIPAPSARNLYTYIGATNPTSGQLLSDHPLATSNTAITDAVLNLGGSDPSRSVLINWARGDEDGDVVNTTSDVRNEMGDPLHSQPAVVIYGASGSSTTDKLNDAVVYVATNDGYLHAFDVMSGTELWAYVPQELLPDLKVLHADAVTSTKHYSLDGDVRVLKYDVDGDGVVEPSDNDRVFLFFSQGRGGSRYYALDVTNKSSPKYLWSLGTADLGNIVTKSWSTPTLGRVRVGSASQNTQRLVLIFGGGYDDVEDSTSYFSAGDPSGNGVFMVDAVKGTVLWSVTKTSSGAFANMTHAIPSSITVIDTNNDGWSDRMYVGDMAGQVWRMDITNGNASGSLVAGGVIATLGGKISATVANNRTFYSPPDVAKLVNRTGSNFYNIAIGSGDRALPKTNSTTQDRFYSIRDYYLGPMTQSQYDGLTAVRDSDLATVDGSTPQVFTDSSLGWKLVLNTGEKVLAQSVTVDGTVMFTTYTAGSSASNVCSVTSGSGRAYSIQAMNAAKRFDDLYETFPVTGLPTQVAIIAPSQVIRTDGTTPTPDPNAPVSTSTPGTCFSGVSILGRCVDFGSRVKTFWQDASAY